MKSAISATMSAVKKKKKDVLKSNDGLEYYRFYTGEVSRTIWAPHFGHVRSGQGCCLL